MYRKIYRQEGGLAEEGYRAQLRQAREKAIEDWNRRTRGEVAERVRHRPRPVHRPVNIPLDTERQQGLSGLQRVGQDFESLVRPPTSYLQTFLGPGANIYDLFNEPEMTPEMVTNLKDILKKQGGFKGTIAPEDYGFPKMKGPWDWAHSLPKTKKEWQSIKEAGPDAVANYLNLGNVPWTLDPTTGKYSFTGTEFDFPLEHGPLKDIGYFIEHGGLTGFLNRLGSKISGEEVDPTTQKPYTVSIPDIYNPETKAALEYGDIEAQREAERRRLEQVDEWGGLADLPEGQVDKVPYLFQPGDLPKDIPISTTPINPYTGVAADRPQPTGFEGTGYGGLARTEQPFKSDITIQQPTEWEETGYGKLSPQEDRWNAIVTLAERDAAMNQYALDNISQPQDPTGWEGTGYGQFSSQPAEGVYTPTGDPGLRPAAPIQQAPIPPIQQAPTLAGPRQPVMPGTPIPPIQTQEQALETGPFINQPSTLGPYPIGMPVTPGGPAIASSPTPAGLKVMRRNPVTGNYEPYTPPNTRRII